MLQLTIERPEMWDEINEQFIKPKTYKLQLEHSLVSLSKWESKWCKSFIHTENKTNEEMLDYIRCMTLTQNVKPEVYNYISQKNINEIVEYINAPMTATTVSDIGGNKKSRERVTSELIYFWMISYNIPFECQKWHLNRLIMLIRVCSAKNAPPKKTSKRELTSRYAEMNARNRAKFNSKG